ncbi:integrase [Rhizobium sp. Root708]|uniref:tyrosine-type recombinase/integrase n=1 Tax=Rhizobium sp. Root708 TaxID=1736592 RepID=UPI0006F9B806|nr:integrase arm-type DNA-binding domain-containing protein [Rhizobium sp. Root708]KRB50973.1 integrase [Rhizobium sp. Root708]
MLSDAEARKLKPNGKPVADGSVVGLYLVPNATGGSGKWILRFMSPTNGKRREMGLGSYPSTSIRDARNRASEARGMIEDGGDPLDVRRERQRKITQLAAIPTFEKAAREHYADKVEGFRNRKHIHQWINTLERFIFPKIGRLPVNTLTPADFAACLKPIWLKKPDTASRVKQRCDAIMNWAAANGYIMASPVSVVDKILPKQPGKRERTEHHPALPWRELPGFFSGMLHAASPSAGRKMLELLILTAARSGELRHVEWEEIDFTNAVWTVPATRMKTKVIHRVPLSARCIEILKAELAKSETGRGLIFRSRSDKPFTDMVLTQVMRDNKIMSDTLGRTATAHGFRSSFRCWASENGYARDLAERALSHTVQNAVEAAYHRTDLLEQRRAMMAAWEGFCLSR